MPDELAVFADPFSVSLHAITRHPPPPSGRVLVYGAGSLGLCAVAILQALYPEVTSRWWPASTPRRSWPAAWERPRCWRTSPAWPSSRSWSRGVAVGCGGRCRVCRWRTPVPVDVVYDTIGKPETFEVGVRVLASRGTLVKAGVHAPGRWEWSPLYFKEINWVGSNAFGVEEVDGVRKHAIAHYLDLVVDGRVDLRPMLTHTFRLEQWRDAFLAIANQNHSGAVKVAIDQR